MVQKQAGLIKTACIKDTEHPDLVLKLALFKIGAELAEIQESLST